MPVNNYAVLGHSFLFVFCLFGVFFFFFPNRKAFGWGDGSIGKALAIKTQGSEFGFLLLT